MKLTFGKYNGKELEWVKDNDISYYRWLKKLPDSPVIKYEHDLVMKEIELILNNLPPIEITTRDLHAVGLEYIIKCENSHFRIWEVIGNQYGINDILCTKEEYELVKAEIIKFY